MKRVFLVSTCAILIISMLCASTVVFAASAEADNSYDPNYFLDFTTDKVISSLGAVKDVSIESLDGYTRLVAETNDPYIYLPVPEGVPSENRYLAIVYRTTSVGGGEIYCEKDDRIPMGETAATRVGWTSWANDGNWHTKIVDISSVCQSGTKFINFRFDPLAAHTVGASIDIKCIAGFDTIAKARAFSLEDYLAELNAPPTWEEPDYNGNVSTGDAYEGTLKYTYNDDGTVTISYVYRGEQKTYTVPNDPIYTSGGFAGVDDLGRSIYNSNTVGIYGDNGEHYVGLFYFLWMGEHGDAGIYDLTKIQHKYGANALNANYVDPTTGQRIYGNIGTFHWMGEPLYGYYYSSDEWVMRKHVELLINAGVDFLYIDCTNGYIYQTNALKLMKVLHEFNELGYNAPKIVFYTNTKAEATVRSIYTSFYRSKKYPDTWLYVDGKPCIITNSKEITIPELKNFFTIKEAQWPNEPAKENSWPWMDFEWPQRVFKDNAGKRDAISVSVAQHCGSVTFSDSAYYFNKYTENNRGRSFMDGMTFWNYRVSIEENPELVNFGYNFQAQWDYAIEQDVPYVLVTGWNEWVAQRQDGEALRGNANTVVFVDTASQEFSRDIEMMRGGYFDNYYMQLVSNIQRLKGTAPIIIQDARNPINIAGGFEQWADVLVKYTDPSGDIMDRNIRGFGSTIYRDFSGRNDIVASKVTNDTKNAYFYVQTAEDIKKYDGNSAWMQLYINVDSSVETGWYGYDYIVNYSVVSDTEGSVARYDKASDSFVEVGKVSYKVSGNEMMIAVPLELLGINNYNEICMEFKWFDADEGIKVDSMEDFYSHGDTAPLGRLNYVYQNCYAEHVTNKPAVDGKPDDNGGNNGGNNGGGDEPNPTLPPLNGYDTIAKKNGCRSGVGGISALAIVGISGVYLLIKRKRRR